MGIRAGCAKGRVPSELQFPQLWEEQAEGLWNIPSVKVSAGDVRAGHSPTPTLVHWFLWFLCKWGDPGHLEGFDSRLPPCGSLILNSGSKAWQQAPLLIDLSHHPIILTNLCVWCVGALEGPRLLSDVFLARALS